MIVSEELPHLLAEFLPQQRWFGAKDRAINQVTVDHQITLKKDWPALIQVIASVESEGDVHDQYHVLLGLRPPGDIPPFLEGGAELVLGELETDQGPALAYEALRDPELAITLLNEVAPGEPVELVRPITAEQSNTSLIFDDRLILKIFRRLVEGPNPDVEIPRALWDAGFTQLPEPIAEWTFESTHTGVLKRYLAGGSEGWALALTSLRDLYAQKSAPEEAGGDFAAEAARLGEMTAQLHIALAKAFGQRQGDPDAWASQMRDQLETTAQATAFGETLDEIFEELRDVDDPGPAIRVHGDYHLGQVMRTDEGWLVLDFEGEPKRDIDIRKQHVSPLKDVAGMLRSFQYAARAALIEHDEDLVKLADLWEIRNREAFLDGYIAGAHPGRILPSDVTSLDIVLRAYELDKAIYEVSYESAHRPDWLEIPLAAIERIVVGRDL